MLFLVFKIVFLLPINRKAQSSNSYLEAVKNSSFFSRQINFQLAQIGVSFAYELFT